MPVRDFANRVHLTTHTSVVDRDDRLCARRDEALKQPFIHVQGVRANVDEHRSSTLQHERVDRGDERERRHDHLVVRLNIEQKRRHLQGVGAGSGQQHPGHAQGLLQEGMALLGKRAIP